MEEKKTLELKKNCPHSKFDGYDCELYKLFGISKIDGHKCIPHKTIENKCEHVISGFTDCCSNCEHLKKNYPPITPEIVLGLINIILKARGEFRIIGSFSKNEVLMENVLKACISIAPEIQDQVRALFNEM